MGYRWGGIQCTYRAGSSIPSPFKILILQIVQLSGWSILQKRRYPQPKVVGSILGCSKLLILSETGILDYSWKNPNFLKDLKIISFLWLCEPKLKATKIKETNIRYVPTRCGCTLIIKCHFSSHFPWRKPVKCKPVKHSHQCMGRHGILCTKRQ